MKLPNRYGTIYRLSGKRRKPYVAKAYLGKALDTSQKRLTVQYKVIGYYATKQAAIEALSAYNSAPYDIGKQGRTLEDVYTAWSAEHFRKVKNPASYVAAVKVLTPILSEQMTDISLDMVQKVMDDSGKNSPTLKTVKSLMTQLYSYALDHDYIPANRRNVYNRLNIGRNNPNAITRRIFSREEIAALWGSREDDLSRFRLLLLFTGRRISELVGATDVDLEHQVIHLHEAKTAAGIRDVPIADKILPLAKAYYSSPREDSKVMRERMKERLSHLPHDTRHTFASMAVECELDQRVIDEIIGHAHQNLTLDVYSHLGLQKKLDAVNLVCARFVC